MVESSNEEAVWDLRGRTVLITGATSGIGAITARELARRGARSVVVGRDPARCEATLAELRPLTGPDAIPEAIVADLATITGVDRLGDEFRSRHDQLHVLLNNAGAMFAERQLTADGFERTFALNHLAYFRLTNLLLETLKASAPARVVNVASDAHRRMRHGMEWDNLMGEQRYRPFRAYCQSKLANILFTRELARRLEGSGVTANCLHPGFVRTRFFLG